jgi:hypothetical protein
LKEYPFEIMPHTIERERERERERGLEWNIQGVRLVEGMV